MMNRAMIWRRCCWAPLLALSLLVGCTTAGDGDGDGSNNGANNGDANNTNNGDNNGQNNTNNGDNNGDACDPACAEDQRCVEGQCVAMPECIGDADCEGGEVCTNGTCQPVEQPDCVQDSDCAQGEVCTEGACVPGQDPAIARCQAACDTIAACPGFLAACPAEVIEATVPACKGACQDNEEARQQITLAGGLSCEQAVPLAIQGFGLEEQCGEPGCAEDGDCAEGEVCVEGACEPAPPQCAQDSDCAQGEVCVDGSCEPAPPECVEDGDCGEGEVCAEGSCEPAPELCIPACAEGQVCTDGACVTPPECVEDGDCAQGQVCTEGSCVTPPECAQDSDCGEGEVCAEGSCEPAPPQCTQDSDCGDGEVCADGSCEPAPPECVEDGDCAQGQVCTEGACVERPNVCVTPGQPCDMDTEAGVGLACVRADNTSTDRVCRPLCAQDSECGEGEFCGFADGNEGSVCLVSNCDSVISGEQCAGLAGGGNCAQVRAGVFYCVEAGEAAPGEFCNQEVGCAAGLACVEERCEQACDTSAPNACGPGQICEARQGLGGDTLGICVSSVVPCEQVGQVCEGSEADNGALRCVSADPGMAEVLTCVAVCGPNQTCANNTTCEIVTRDDESLALCVASNCDNPLDVEACAGLGANGGNCVPFNDTVQRCRPAGDGVESERCFANEDCGAGLTCFAGACRQICETGAQGSCGQNTVCADVLPTEGYGACIPENSCTSVGQVCDEATQDTPALACVDGDSTNNLITCHLRCDIDQGDADCPEGSFCAELGEELSVCIRSNCTSPINPGPDCGDVGANGGDCVPTGNGALFCFAAGEAAEGEACAVGADCGAGLNCFNGACTPYCLVGVDATCGGDLECLRVLNSSDEYGLCGQGCPGFDTTNECGPDQGCLPIGPGEGFCVDTGDVALGQACEPGQCGPFAVCSRVSANEPRTCVAMCDVTEGFGDQDCQQGDICLGLNDAVGGCFDGCSPFTEETGCVERNLGNCVPVGNQERGVCIESGAVPLGGQCELLEGSVFGDCAPGLACDVETGAQQGTCAALCRTFSSVNDYESGCRGGQVCATLGAEWGVCSNDVDPQRPAPLEACPEQGQWCDDDSLCFAVGEEGDNICLPLCRLDIGGEDCPGELVCSDLLASDTFGVCVNP